MHIFLFKQVYTCKLLTSFTVWEPTLLFMLLNIQTYRVGLTHTFYVYDRWTWTTPTPCYWSNNGPMVVSFSAEFNVYVIFLRNVAFPSWIVFHFSTTRWGNSKFTLVLPFLSLHCFCCYFIEDRESNHAKSSYFIVCLVIYPKVFFSSSFF